jgi:hypothetical protein
LPQAIAHLIGTTDKIEYMLTQQHTPQQEENHWFDINALRQYLPDLPARQTVYQWVAAKSIPFHKKGKKLIFLKTDIFLRNTKRYGSKFNHL